MKFRSIITDLAVALPILSATPFAWVPYRARIGLAGADLYLSMVAISTMVGLAGAPTSANAATDLGGPIQAYVLAQVEIDLGRGLQTSYQSDFVDGISLNSIEANLFSDTGSYSDAKMSVSPTNLYSYSEAQASSPDGPYEANLATSTSFLAYEVEVTGPSNLDVPVNVEAVISAAAGGGGDGYLPSAGFAFSTLALSGPGVTQQWMTCASTFDPGCLGGNQHIFAPEILVTNSIYEISEEVMTTTTEGGIGTAAADPYFFIDPGFVELNPGLSIVVSDGVANAPPALVPEPSTWAMMLVGFGGLGAMMRVRRRIAAAV